MGIQINGQTDTVASTTSGGSVTLTSATLPSVSNISATRVNVTGVSTFTSGPVLIGSGTSTGTASQTLQVTGGAYFSGIGASVGIGTTNPTNTVDILDSSASLRIKSTSSGANLNIDSAPSANQYSPQISFLVGGNGKWAIGGANIGAASSTAFSLYNYTAGNNPFTVDVNSNFLIRTISATGTSSQPLQVNGGAYVSSNLGIGATNPVAQFHIGGTSSNNNPWAVLDIEDSYFKRIHLSEARTAYGVGAYGGYIGYDAYNNTLSFGTYENSTENRSLNIKRETGSIGIGTINPSTSLHVSGKVLVVTSGTPGGTYNFAYNAHTNSGTTGLQITSGSNYAYFLGDGSNIILASDQGSTGQKVIVSRSSPDSSLTVDSSGRVIKPYQPAFQAFVNTNTAIASGTNVLPFNSTNFNIGSHYNTTNYRFTAPVAGRYLFSVNLNLYSTPGIMMPAVRINGSSLYYGSRLLANINGDNNLNLTIILSLSQNDYVESLSANQGSSASLSAGASWNRFEGYLIG